MGLKEQILAVRDSGLVNMFDVRGVQQVAVALGHHELASYLAECGEAYWRFIMTGDESALEW